MSLSTRQKILIAKLAHRMVRTGRALVRKPMQGRFVRDGLVWQLDLDEGIDFAIWLLGAFEGDLVRWYRPLVPEGAVVMDIGANIGAHTQHLARAVGPTGRVVAVEPTDFAVGKLRANLALNPDLEKRVEVIHGFLAASAAEQPGRSIPSSWPLTGSAAEDDALGGALKTVGDVRVTTVDLVVEELALTRVDWIKLDVDGHELGVLEGASEMLRRFSPRIMMELAPYCYRDKPALFGKLVATLCDAGYRFFTIPREAALPSSPAELETRHIPRNGSINVVARKV